MIKQHSQMSFSQVFVDKKVSKNLFFIQMKQVMNWKQMEKLISAHYSVGNQPTGQPSYSGLLLFKMLLIGIWYDLSDRDCELMVNDSLSAMRFCDLQLEDSVPDHTVLSRFRTELTEKGVFDLIFQQVNVHLEQKGVILKKGIKLDASLTDSLRKPKGDKKYEIAQDRKEDELTTEQRQEQEQQINLVAKIQTGVDQEGKWLKKAGKLHYGYKKHIGVDENGLVLGVVTTAANEHDSICFEQLVDECKLPKEHKAAIYADKAYQSQKNSEILNKRELVNKIHYKEVKNKPLTEEQKARNSLYSKERYMVERTFGSMVLWFGSGLTRYVGKAKTHTQHLLESICYNLKRAPKIIIGEVKVSRLIMA
jgi:IS5 family transposase